MLHVYFGRLPVHSDCSMDADTLAILRHHVVKLYNLHVKAFVCVCLEKLIIMDVADNFQLCTTAVVGIMLSANLSCSYCSFSM